MFIKERERSMKKIIQVLLCTALTTSNTYSYTNKTFLMPRAQGANLALESSAGWYELINKNAPERFGGNMQAAAFFQGTTDQATVGQYFGINGNNKVSLGTISLAGIGGNINNIVTAQDFDLLYLIHTPANDVLDATKNPNNPNITAAAGTAIFAPKQTTYGAYVNYYQNLDRLLKGLYFNVVMPIVRVKNEPNFAATGIQANTIQSFFDGTYQKAQVTTPAPTISYAQDPLKYGIINDSQTVQTGVADIDLTFGYACWDKRYAHASLNVGFTIPTGNEPSGKYLFEAVIGNGTHYGFGAGGDLWVRLYGNMETNLKYFFKTNYRYLFGSTETRTVGLKGHNWGQYLLLGSTVTGENDRAIPAANILTQPVEVTPGNQVDLITGLNYNIRKISFELGYNFFFKGREAVILRSPLAENTYGILARNYNFQTTGVFKGPFTNTNPQIDGSGKPLTTDDLDVTAAETPRQITHKIFVGASYSMGNWSIPVLMGLGGHAEFASANSTFNTWGAFGKVAVKF